MLYVAHLVRLPSSRQVVAKQLPNDDDIDDYYEETVLLMMMTLMMIMILWQANKHDMI